MERPLEHRVSEFMIVGGFLTFLSSVLGAIFHGLDTELSTITAFSAFAMFLIGVEIYLRTRKTHHGAHD